MMPPTSDDGDPIITPEQPPCRLLSLAAELRNRIWELACTPDTNIKINIAEAESHRPKPHLLLTCKQIKEEATSIWKFAEPEYWASTHFTIDNSHGRFHTYDDGEYGRCQQRNEVVSLQCFDHHQIRHLTIIGPWLEFTYDDQHWSSKLSGPMTTEDGKLRKWVSIPQNAVWTDIVPIPELKTCKFVRMVGRYSNVHPEWAEIESTATKEEIEAVEKMGQVHGLGKEELWRMLDWHSQAEEDSGYVLPWDGR